jgi:hypothetical protein
VTKEQRKRLVLRWSLFAAALSALFWGVWSLFAPVPGEASLAEEFPSMFITVPISRWADPLFAAALAAAISWTVTHPKFRSGKDTGLAVIGSLVVGVISFGKPFALFIFVTTGLFCAILSGPAAILGIGIGSGTISALVYGPVVGLCVFAYAAIVAALASVLPAMVLAVVRASFWKKLGHAIRRGWSWMNAEASEAGVPPTEPAPEVRDPSEMKTPESAYVEAVRVEREAFAAYESCKARRAELEKSCGGSEQGARIIALRAERL